MDLGFVTAFATREVLVPGWVLVVIAAAFIWRPALRQIASFRRARAQDTALEDQPLDDLFAYVTITQGVDPTRRVLTALLRKRRASMSADVEEKSQEFLQEHGDALFNWVLEPTTAPLLRLLREIAEDQGPHHAEAVLSGNLGSILVHNAREDGAIVPDDHVDDSGSSDTDGEEVDEDATDDASDGDASGENATDEDATDEDATDEDATDEDATDEDASDEDATDEDATDEDASDEDASDEEATDEDADGDASDEDATDEDADGDASSEDADGDDSDGSEKVGNTGVRRAVSRISASRGVEAISASL
jgi:hypothetical protein